MDVRSYKIVFALFLSIETILLFGLTTKSAMSQGIHPAYQPSSFDSPSVLTTPYLSPLQSSTASQDTDSATRQETPWEPSQDTQHSATTAASTNQESRTRRRPPSPPRSVAKNLGTFISTDRFNFSNFVYNIYGYSEFPVQGRLKVADNNSAAPDDRFIFRYNHHHNALDSQVVNAAGAVTNRSSHLDYYTVGFEKSFRNRCWSLEVRMPVFGARNEVFSDGFSTDVGSVGNLAFIVKRVLSQNDCRVISAGLGVTAATGDDANFIVVDEQLTVKNRASHIVPYLACLWTPSERVFVHSFLELDVATDGNPVEYRDLLPGGANYVLGHLNSQTLLSYDVSLGYWWYRNPCNRISGVASLLEFHYVGTVNDADIVSCAAGCGSFGFGNYLNSFNMLSLTAGIDVEICNCTNLRFAGAVPLRDNDDRFSDGEVQSSINWRY